MLHAAHGVLHDDDVNDEGGTGASQLGGTTNTYHSGYGDNLDCGVRIRAGT